MRDSHGYWIVIRSTSGQTVCPHTVHCKNIPKDMRTLVSFYLCFALLASTPLLASTQKSSADLDALIDIGLNYAERSIEERQTAIEQALVILEVSATEQTEQHTKVDLALSYLQYQSGDIFDPLR